MRQAIFSSDIFVFPNTLGKGISVGVKWAELITVEGELDVNAITECFKTMFLPLSSHL